eukprot:Nitzschia sp. Nitz4//scaffold28_size193895//127777//128681//NITZ4_001670-RA/size193895-snap-gene-0.325-mRNA-1//1//CDS//3329545997//9067//frame0
MSEAPATEDKSKDETPVSSAEQYQQTANQLESIEREIKETQPLTSELKILEELKQWYPADEPASKYFLLGIDSLSKNYGHMRQTRGDGNCYYRSFLYSLSESLLSNPTELERIISYAKESLGLVTSVGGYEESVIEIFYDSFVEHLESLRQCDAATLHSELTEENAVSDYCTWYFRVLTATFLKADPDRFLPYLEDGYADIYTFCQHQIEPMGKECTMVQVLALAEAFQVKVVIEYLDGHEFEADASLARHSFGPEEAATTLTLLYRPGHYDILYVK